MRRRTITTTALLGALLLLLTIQAPAAAHSTAVVTYRPPADAPLVDTFRPPQTPYGPGNRGLDYGTTAGQPVLAAADGEVVFAGRVGNGLHAVVLHADGIRTSYSFLGGITVHRGDHVRQGDPIGTADDTTPLHFGARAPSTIGGADNRKDVYLDPLELLGQASNDGRTEHAHLVADPHPERPLTEAEERAGLQQLLRGVGHAATQATGWVTQHAEATLEDELELAKVVLDDLVDLGVPIPVYVVVAALRWQDAQATCTPATTPVPGPPIGRRIVVLVGGLGSETGDAAVLRTHTRELGYADADVHQFSYRSDGKPYTPAESEGDLDQAARALAHQMDDLATANPGVPIDLIAHSVGGLFSRAAVVLLGARPALLATLGTPHHGADLATAEVGLRHTTTGRRAIDAVNDHLAKPIASLDLDQTSIHQLSETSAFLDRLDHAPLPPPTQTRTISIAVRGDPIVPNHQSRLAGADNAVISTTGALNEHAGLPGAGATTDELLRALAGQPPTCRSLVDALADEAIGRQASQVQDGLGLALTGGSLYLDARAKRAVTPRPHSIRPP
jgi:hypothetical protein